jgi:hypothetical protein
MQQRDKGQEQKSLETGPEIHHWQQADFFCLLWHNLFAKRLKYGDIQILISLCQKNVTCNRQIAVLDKVYRHF